MAMAKTAIKGREIMRRSSHQDRFMLQMLVQGYLALQAENQRLRRGWDALSLVSHELRSPLNAILGSLSLMQDGMTGEIPQEARRMVEISSRNSRRMLRLVNDLLDIRKIESDKLSVEMWPVRLEDVVQQAVEANHGLGLKHDVSFAVHRDAPATMVKGNTDRLIQVITNLLQNAINVSPVGARVVVRVSPRGEGRVRVSVTDQGSGIPRSCHDQVFRAFARIDQNSSGIGLGLCIVKALVERMGGQVGFHSVVNIGSTFFFDLPTCSGDNHLPEASVDQEQMLAAGAQA